MYMKWLCLQNELLNRNEFIVDYWCLNRLGRFIKVQKDRNTLMDNNNVVYRISCMDCDRGMKRKLKTRLNENVKNDTLLFWIISLNTTIQWKNFRISDFEPKYHKKLILKMICTQEQKNGFNLNRDMELLDESYFNILNKLAKNT